MSEKISLDSSVFHGIIILLWFVNRMFIRIF